MEKLELLKQIISLATVLLNLALNPALPADQRVQALNDSTTILRGASQMIVALNASSTTTFPTSTLPEAQIQTSTPETIVMPQVIYVPVVPQLVPEPISQPVPSISLGAVPQKVRSEVIDSNFGQDLCIGATRIGVQFRYSKNASYTAEVTVGNDTQTVPITSGLGFINLEPDTVYERTVKLIRGNNFAISHDKVRTQPADQDFCAGVTGINVFDAYWE